VDDSAIYYPYLLVRSVPVRPRTAKELNYLYALQIV
jgi:hypothetical protein